MEYLDIVDEQGQPTGEIVSRTFAHTKGIRHRTAHIWIVRRENEHFQVLMQKRAMSKDSFPGKYDTSSAGHIQAGDEPLASGLRELAEELDFMQNRKILHLPDASTEILQKNSTEKSSGTTKLPLSMSISSLSISRHLSCKKRRWNRCGGLIWKKHTRTVETVTRSFVPLSRDSKLYGNTCTVEIHTCLSYLRSLSASSSFSNNVSVRILKAGIKLSRISMIISFTSSSFHIWTDVLRLFNISSYTSASLINPT